MKYCGFLYPTSREISITCRLESVNSRAARSSRLSEMKADKFLPVSYGKEPVTAFDDFVKQWQEKGGTQITQEVNEWYKSASSGDFLTQMGLK